MRVKFWGTRGSVPVASESQMTYGGNTTAVQIESECLPETHRLVIDAGSGFVPFSASVMRGSTPLNELVLHLFLTHYHHDHTQGLLLSPLTFILGIDLRLYGPVELGVGPRETMQAIMRPPLFPVEYTKVASHFRFQKFDVPNTFVLVFHPRGGVKVMRVDNFTRKVEDNGHLPVGKGGSYPISECLVVKMLKSNHPERTISYRFEEGPTGKVFVFLTDHENQPGIPAELRTHVTGADLLVLDGQYNQGKYDLQTCGFGHGTGKYCAWLAHECRAKRLGLTHHDPFSTDEMVEAILAEARDRLDELNTDAEATIGKDDIFACADYQTVDV